MKTIEVSKNPEWQGGLTCDLVKISTKKYRPDAVIALEELTTKLSKTKLGKRYDPVELKDEIAATD